MKSEKRRDWYDEIYDTYILMHLMGDESSIKSWSPFGKNSINITFKDGGLFRYNYFTNSIVRLDKAKDDLDELSEQMKEFFPRKLNKAIGDACLTQNALAERMNVPENTISRYCSGSRIPNIITISIMAKILDCELYELIPYYDKNSGRIE